MLTWWWHQPLEVKIAGQCAPVLAGVKPSNMLVLENKHIRDVVRTLEGTGLSWRCLYAGSEKNIWLLYRKEALQEIVSREEERMFLKFLRLRIPLNPMFLSDGWWKRRKTHNQRYGQTRACLIVGLTIILLVKRKRQFVM